MNKTLYKLTSDTQKSVGALSELAYETGVQDGLIKANALNALKPLDNTEMRWIPCSERLPKQENEEQRRGVYLTTNAYGYVGVSKYEFCGDFGFVGWGDNRPSDIRIVAWMPMPKPYKEGNG